MVSSVLRVPVEYPYVLKFMPVGFLEAAQLKFLAVIEKTLSFVADGFWVIVIEIQVL